MCKDNLRYCFSIMFVVFYTANLYIFVFMACSTPCCLMIHLWIQGTYVCMYMCIHTHTHIYICRILRAEEFFDAAMILSLVREVNSCRSIYPSLQCYGNIQVPKFWNSKYTVPYLHCYHILHSQVHKILYT
jgi:hypothetical protein